MEIGSNHSISKNPVLQVSINGAPANQVRETRILGVTLDSKVFWTEHINNFVAKIRVFQ